MYLSFFISFLNFAGIPTRDWNQLCLILHTACNEIEEQISPRLWGALHFDVESYWGQAPA